MQKVVLLGSTGSVGKSSLEVIEKNKEKYEVACLVAPVSYTHLTLPTTFGV